MFLVFENHVTWIAKKKRERLMIYIYIYIYPVILLKLLCHVCVYRRVRSLENNFFLFLKKKKTRLIATKASDTLSLNSSEHRLQPSRL